MLYFFVRYAVCDVPVVPAAVVVAAASDALARLGWHAGISNVAASLFLTSLLLLTSSLRQLPCNVFSVMILLSLLLLSTFLLPFPRVLDVAGVPGDIAVSKVLVVCADDPAVGDVLTAASSSEVPAVTGVLLLFPCCCCVPW
jgi:hypothetical protein